MSGVGPSLPKRAVRATSAFPPIATELRTWREVRKVPTTEVVNIHLASDTTDSFDYIRDRAEDLACDYFKSRKRA
jgi:hypothetical protein